VALLGKFFGRTAAEGAAYAFGVATGPVLAPATETIRQEAWNTYQTRIPAVGVLAEGVAQGQVPLTEAQDWAHKQGYADTAFSALVDIANTGPGSGYAFELWRRNIIGPEDFKRALKRLGIEQEWIDDLVKIKIDILDPADLARAIHRGLIPDPGLLKGNLPKGVGNVPAYPVYDIDALAEALGSGIDHDRLGVLVGLQGLPMGSHEAAQAFFRKILTDDDYLRAIAEGNTRNEWAEAIKEQSRSIPSPTNYVAALIKGWIKPADMHAGAARHGMTTEDADLLALIAGNPVTTHQAFIGHIRGGRVEGENWNERETFRRAVIQSHIRPEWEPILWAQRYSYPSAFVLRSLTQSGDISQADAEEVLLFSGWEPSFAKKVSAAWAPTGTAKADSHVTSEQNRLRTTTHSSYLSGEISKTVARNSLTVAGVASASLDAVMRIWDTEKNLIRAQLTAANVKKAFNKGGKNNATGQKWTRDEALAALIELGWAALAANDYLDIP
jgi:hypothetical protein